MKYRKDRKDEEELMNWKEMNREKKIQLIRKEETEGEKREERLEEARRKKKMWIEWRTRQEESKEEMEDEVEDQLEDDEDEMEEEYLQKGELCHGCVHVPCLCVLLKTEMKLGILLKERLVPLSNVNQINSQEERDEENPSKARKNKRKMEIEEEDEGPNLKTRQVVRGPHQQPIAHQGVDGVQQPHSHPFRGQGGGGDVPTHPYVPNKFPNMNLTKMGHQATPHPLYSQRVRERLGDDGNGLELMSKEEVTHGWGGQDPL